MRPDTTSIKVYGYMRVDDESDEALFDLETALQRYADIRGYQLVEIFAESTPGCQRTFAALVDELRCTGVRHVVVPSMEHLARHPLLRTHMLIRLELEADAQVFEAGEA
ncbi:hypothetical protein LK07_20595 [Streptomyces pluripotens]|uniref:Resolvase/invertase-type recombinase catalytic domain-containing protein n=1 Tax=Streptomyces pluripotens TaxID=1355015 RepID=A0A221P1S8_9ACTN|nr:recombinase family protein [Streptomyces pluripotens]ARP71755.1 hypothetical protein LK06_019430 [Streptomyces pluripotens]ASN26008.1 hypothetical protein LK07_20595 [Streptomyces pluripotens]